MNLENYFKVFRENTIGYNVMYNTPYGMKKMIYADWTASGRLYQQIEDKILKDFGPFVGNTHSESNKTGITMTTAYNIAREEIKKHVNANENDVIIMSGFGMTSVVNKLQRILGLRICEKYKNDIIVPQESKPVVFITHMEHHSNHISWLETFSDVVIIEPDKNGLIDLDSLRDSLKKYSDRSLKIGSFTACSNITGIQTPYHKMAKIMHEYDGICFVDFAASAPYEEINMHPEDPFEKLDGIFFSPHKFLGGPGTSGVMIFDSGLYNCEIPDIPGGGTVTWTNPWGEKGYISNIELREDGGTPGFLQAIRTALCISLKNKMSIDNMLSREKDIMKIIFNELQDLENLNILAPHIQDRLGIFSFYSNEIHYNLFVKILNDRFGIQVRGGCSCAGTYGHYLLKIGKYQSKEITNLIDRGIYSEKPGWVRLSIHPIMTNEEIYYITDSIKKTVKYYHDWKTDYRYNENINEFINILPYKEEHNIKKCFVL